jgi:hypothetical protein
MMKVTKMLITLLLAVPFLIPLDGALADVAPPSNPPGGDVSPEGDTQVQMVAEQVTIDFRQYTDDSAAVTAWFLFRNTGDSAEHLGVRFPLNGDPRMNEQMELDYPLIDDFTASVGGQRLATQVIRDDDPNAPRFFLGWDTVMYWARFDMDFPVGTDVKLTISYTLHPTTEQSNAFPLYLLATGAGWKGPIGKVDVIFRFPYILNEYNFPEFKSYSTPDPQSSRTVLVQENEVRMHWDDLEPTERDNVELGILQPHLWQAILQCRLQVISLPDDASAWLNLARAYAAAGQQKHGLFYDENLALLYIHAMERALTLNPNNASLHAEFARNMAYALAGSSDYYDAIVQNELATALKLDPNNADVQSTINDLGQYHSITLTTPGPFPTYGPTQTLTLTPVPTLTMWPTATNPPTEIPAASTSTPVEETTEKRSNLLVTIPLGLGLFGAGLVVGYLIKKGR